MGLLSRNRIRLIIAIQDLKSCRDRTTERWVLRSPISIESESKGEAEKNNLCRILAC